MAKKIDVCRVEHYRKIKDLEVHPDNPRTISRDRLNDLKDSIIKKGFYEPILIWNEKVISGNHRLIAVRELIKEGWKIGEDNSLPVVIEECSEDMAKQILFETNNRYAEWIDEKVREALNAADKADLAGFGFSSAELDIWIDKAEGEARSTMETIYSDLDEDDDSDWLDLPDEKVAPEAKVTDKVTSREYEQQKALVLPQSTYNKFIQLLLNVAKQAESSWKEGDDIAIVIDLLCDYLDDEPVE